MNTTQDVVSGTSTQEVKRRRGRPRKAKEQLVERVKALDIHTGALTDRWALIEDKSLGVIDLEEQERKKEQDSRYQKSLTRDEFVQGGNILKEIVGKLKQSELHALMLLIPYMQYDEKPLKRDGALLSLQEVYEEIWGVSKVTGSQYMKTFKELELLDTMNASGSKRTKFVTVKRDFLFRGERNFSDYNVKIFQKKMQEVIEKVNQQIISSNNRRRKKLDLYPLALLAAILPHFHFQTFFLVRNPNEIVIKDGETVQEVLKNSRKRRRIKFLKNKELWTLMTGQELGKSNLSKEKTERLGLYFKMLKRAGAIGVWGGETDLYLVNPNLMFVTPNTRNMTWYDSITALFESTKD